MEKELNKEYSIKNVKRSEIVIKVTIYQKPFIVEIDDCIAEEIVKLNKLGVRTVNSCCGHGKEKPLAIIENDRGSLKRAIELGYTVRPFGEGILFSEIELKSKCKCKR